MAKGGLVHVEVGKEIIFEHWFVKLDLFHLGKWKVVLGECLSMSKKGDCLLQDAAAGCF